MQLAQSYFDLKTKIIYTIDANGNKGVHGLTAIQIRSGYGSC